MSFSKCPCNADQVNSCRFGNRYFENYNAEEEVPGEFGLSATKEYRY